MELEPGKDVYSHGTFECNDYPGCEYQDPVTKRCIFNIARLKIRVGRACYDDLRRDEIECELDYLDSVSKKQYLNRQ